MGQGRRSARSRLLGEGQSSSDRRSGARWHEAAVAEPVSGWIAGRASSPSVRPWHHRLDRTPIVSSNSHRVASREARASAPVVPERRQTALRFERWVLRGSARTPAKAGYGPASNQRRIGTRIGRPLASGGGPGPKVPRAPDPGHTPPVGEASGAGSDGGRRWPSMYERKRGILPVTRQRFVLVSLVPEGAAQVPMGLPDLDSPYE
jgi:hypothetical protein